MTGRVTLAGDGGFLFHTPTGQSYPLWPDERIPREKLIQIGDHLHAHPLMVIELVCGDDLNARAETALMWMQDQIAERAAAAVDRIERMYRPETFHERYARTVREYFARIAERARAERAALIAHEGDYRFPAVEEQR